MLPHDFNMKEPCDICHIKEWERIKFGKFVCDTCQPDWDGFPYQIETVILLKGQPGEERSSKAEIDEIKRNRSVFLKDGSWKCGRMGDNGKIQEKPIKV